MHFAGLHCEYKRTQPEGQKIAWGEGQVTPKDNNKICLSLMDRIGEAPLAGSDHSLRDKKGKKDCILGVALFVEVRRGDGLATRSVMSQSIKTQD